MAHDKDPLIAAAITLAGSQSALAEAMTRAGVPCVQQTISKLLTGELRVDADFAIAIDRATASGVPRWRLRPDLFEAPASAEAAA